MRPSTPENQGQGSHCRAWFPQAAGPFLWLAALLALAGILAPVFYWLFSPYFDHPFSRFTNRALLVAALVCLGPYLWRHRRGLGLAWQAPDSAAFLGFGFALGALSEALLLGIHLAAGTRHWAAASWPLAPLAGALATGAAVGFIEEILFRGAIQRELVKRCGTIAGIALASAFYAITHYVKVPPAFKPSPVTWTSGYEAIGLALAPLAEPATYVDLRFFNLLLVGLILGLAYHRTGSLWLPIGLHAGWVFGIKWGDKLTNASRPGWFAPDLTDSGLTTCLLFLLLAGAFFLKQPPVRADRAHAAG